MTEDEQDQVEANDDVGMSLTAGEEADAIVGILRGELGHRLRVTDCITYVKLETDIGQLEVSFADVAAELGHRFTLSDFQTVLASYYGRPLLGDDGIGVYSSMTAGVLDGESQA